jgi:hypothetical protein
LEYKADVCCPRNTSAAEVDNSVEKLTGDSTVRNVGNDEISPEDSHISFIFLIHVVYLSFASHGLKLDK